MIEHFVFSPFSKKTSFRFVFVCYTNITKNVFKYFDIEIKKTKQLAKFLFVFLNFTLYANVSFLQNQIFRIKSINYYRISYNLWSIDQILDIKKNFFKHLLLFRSDPHLFLNNYFRFDLFFGNHLLLFRLHLHLFINNYFRFDLFFG